MPTPTPLLAEPPPLPAISQGAPDQLEVVRVLLVLQGALAAAATLETLVVSLVLGGSLIVPSAISILLAVATFWAAAHLPRGSHRARIFVFILEGLWLAGAVVDLALSLVLVHRGIGLVPTLTRVAVPLAVLWMLRAPTVKEMFRKDRT